MIGQDSADWCLCGVNVNPTQSIVAGDTQCLLASNSRSTHLQPVMILLAAPRSGA